MVPIQCSFGGPPSVRDSVRQIGLFWEPGRNGLLTSIKYELEISDNLLKHSTEVMFPTLESFLFIEFIRLVSVNHSILTKSSEAYDFIEKNKLKAIVNIITLNHHS